MERSLKLGLIRSSCRYWSDLDEIFVYLTDIDPRLSIKMAAIAH